jgi:threonine/homoserine/homoserine lactone efflux protein
MSSPTRTPRRSVAAGVLTALTVVVCAGLLGAAALVPAPPAVLPLVAVICIGCPMFAAWQLARSLGDARARPAMRPGAQIKAIEDLRRALDQLPETHHPLGF